MRFPCWGMGIAPVPMRAGAYCSARAMGSWACANRTGRCEPPFVCVCLRLSACVYSIFPRPSKNGRASERDPCENGSRFLTDTVTSHFPAPSGVSHESRWERDASLGISPPLTLFVTDRLGSIALFNRRHYPHSITISSNTMYWRASSRDLP